MILSDAEIRQHCDGTGDKLVFPFNEDQLQPASYDVRLGNTFRVFERDHNVVIDLDDPVDITKAVDLEDGMPFTLHPGEFVLAHTVERFALPTNIVGRVEGKSSLGRLGLLVHATAGFIDPGFRGNITLEMACFHPLAIRLHPGQLIGQISFHFMSDHAERPYQGRYQGDEGVASSRFGALVDFPPAGTEVEVQNLTGDNARFNGRRGMYVSEIDVMGQRKGEVHCNGMDGGYVLALEPSQMKVIRRPHPR